MFFKIIKNIFYFILVIVICAITIYTISSWRTDVVYNQIQDEINTIDKYHYEVNNNSIFTFFDDGFKCYLPNKPTIQESNTQNYSGKHFFALDSIDYFLYSINIHFDGAINNNYRDTETFLKKYFSTYLNNTPLLVNPKILDISSKIFQSKFQSIEYQFISNEIKAPMLQYGILLIKDDDIYKLSLNFPQKSMFLTEKKYKQLISSFIFI